MLVLRAGRGHDRQRQLVHQRDDAPLAQVEHGAYLRDVRAGHIGAGLEAGDLTREQQVHHEGLHRVVKVVPQRELVAAARLYGVVERAAPHLGAERAGVFLLPRVEHYLADVRLNDGVRHLVGLAPRADRREVHVREAHVYGYCLQLEARGVVAPQVPQRGQQRHGILPSRDADGHPVAGHEHFVVVHAAADKACKAIQIHFITRKIKNRN